MSTVGKYFESTLIRGIDEGIGTAQTVQSMQGAPRDGSLELMTGISGPVGPAGAPCRAFRWEGDIADQAALFALGPKLGPAHAGKTWRVLTTDTMMYWNGTSFDSFTDAFGAAGPDGEPCTITIGAVTTGPVGSELQASITGTAPNLVLNLTVPQGGKGEKGERGGPGPIRKAPDYADGTHIDGAVPMWEGTSLKWTPRPYPGLRGPWSIVESTAWDGGAGFTASQGGINSAQFTVAQLRIPAQDTDWRPVITGGVIVRTDITGSFDHRVDAEVRIGSPNGQIVAFGSGIVFGVDGFLRFQPHYATPGMTPQSNVGVLPAGTAATIFVVLRRNRGSSNYTYTQGGAQIVCWAQPVRMS
ncbi:hypothetical protein [Nocardia crassostreae]|uniref:hypothetical protein n=1 Tax=Nocardia crassostreae TaxID=53428 RepID=UPI000A90B70C|nr:hypothetical protein [Nocardia crassostreae]